MRNNRRLFPFFSRPVLTAILTFFLYAQMQIFSILGDPTTGSFPFNHRVFRQKMRYLNAFSRRLSAAIYRNEYFSLNADFSFQTKSIFLTTRSLQPLQSPRNCYNSRPIYTLPFLPTLVSVRILVGFNYSFLFSTTPISLCCIKKFHFLSTLFLLIRITFFPYLYFISHDVSFNRFALLPE